MSDPDIFRKLDQLLKEGRGAVLCTLIEKSGSGPRNEGAKMLIYEEGNSVSTIGGGGMERLLSKEALRVLDEGRPRTLTFSLGVEPKKGTIKIDSKCGGEVKIFMDPIKPDPRLIVIGSGHIGKPLAEFASKAGFKVAVVDDAVTTTPERFPGMELHPGSFEDELENVAVRSFDLVAIVHGETDYELVALRSVLKRNPSYIGLLGSGNKAREHKKQLRAEGFNKDAVERIHAPIGLDIGAVTPEEIAVSILAELIKARRD
jgi:xanthine dehydrogenase accessory factor